MQRTTIITAVIFAGALATAPRSASAGPLDYQGLAFQSQGTGTSSVLAGVETGNGGAVPVFASTSSSSSERPIYRRRPYRDRYRDRYDDNDQPRYFGAFGAGTFDPDDQPGNGLWMNGELGSEVGDALDLGVRVNWYHRQSDNSQVVSTYTDEAGNVHERVLDTNNIETNLVPLMAILRVRFPVSRDFQPYVGGGIGWEWLTVSGTDSTGFDFQDDYDGFGGQVFAGLNVGVSPTLNLYGEALWNKSTVSARFFDPFVGATIKDEIDMDGLGLHGGLRFSF
ncbi:MAG TPA: outer membrane beta-barrel protein [Candidatus Omnitrophota bacterium]|nr:outer membrane beta-barrel protein [Candidatus Omnitrophota bacterium]